MICKMPRTKCILISFKPQKLPISMWVTIGQLFLSLSILVILHECGHFFPAKWFKTRVEKFYLFFDPYFSLFKKKIGDTEYGVGWLPLGGYVKIAGMVDESFDTKQLQNEPQPWEFRSKPAWQRLIIMVGGVTVNFLVGFAIFSGLLWKNGQEYINTADLKYGIATDSLSRLLGFQDGDLIVGIQGEKLEKFDPGKILKDLALNDKNTINLIRNGAPMDLIIPEDKISLLTKNENKKAKPWTPRFPFIVDSVVENSIASSAGIQSGDRIISINGEPKTYFHEVIPTIFRKPNQDFAFQILRGQDTVSINLHTDDSAIIGIKHKLPNDLLHFQTREYSFIEAIPAGVSRGIELVTDQVKAFGHMFTGRIKAKESLGGFAAIAGLFHPTWDWDVFWATTAIISIILAFMNILPIPALDGGYIMFLLYEVVSGRKVSDKFMEKATMIGFILLLGLLLYANGLDLIRYLNKS